MELTTISDDKDSKIDTIKQNCFEEEFQDDVYFFNTDQYLCPNESKDNLFNGYESESDDGMSRAIQLYVNTYGDETP
jgi:hypothetical protein